MNCDQHMHRTIPDTYFWSWSYYSPSFIAFSSNFFYLLMCLHSLDNGKFGEGVSMKSGTPDDVTHCFSRALPLKTLYI